MTSSIRIARPPGWFERGVPRRNGRSLRTSGRGLRPAQGRARAWNPGIRQGCSRAISRAARRCASGHRKVSIPALASRIGVSTPPRNSFLAIRATRRSALSSQPQVGASTRSAVWAENQAYCRRHRCGSFETRLRSGVGVRSGFHRLAPGTKQMPSPAARARPAMHLTSAGGSPPVRIASIGADRIAASNRPR